MSLIPTTVCSASRPQDFVVQTVRIGSTLVAMSTVEEQPAALENATDCTEFDKECMREALLEAEGAVAKGNHPFGAVLALDGKIVRRGQNCVVRLASCD